MSGLTLDTPDARLVDLVENLSWRYQSGIYPASHGPDVTRAAMTGFKALTPQELDKLELITRLRCGQRKFAVATGENFLTGEQGQPLGYFMRDALRACYEARIGQSLASCVRALRRQGFPQTYASNMQAARSMMASAAGTVLGSARHYAHAGCIAAARCRLGFASVAACRPGAATGAGRRTDHGPVGRRWRDAASDGLIPLAAAFSRKEGAHPWIPSPAQMAMGSSQLRSTTRKPISTGRSPDGTSAPGGRRYRRGAPSRRLSCGTSSSGRRSLHRRAGPLPPRQRASPRRRAPA